MIARSAQQRLTYLATKFKAIAVVGARQSGKTTLVRTTFSDKTYISLENLDARSFAIEDPRGFLATYSDGAIFDEIQRAPQLFAYLQEVLDNETQPGKYILTGSNNFLLQENISQSLAGRVGYLELLPFSITELHQAKILSTEDNELMLKGFYPPIYDQAIPFEDWYPNYIRTYIDRDVRQLKNIGDLIQFERFVRIIAGRHGQEVNYNAIAVEVGIDLKTVQSWVGLLQASYIVYLLKPHYKNYNKTIVKRPKLYFYDAGLVCSLLNIHNYSHLTTHPLRGAIFEGMVVMEFLKQRLNIGRPSDLFFWRDKTGHEIDLIIDDGGQITAIEIKSGQTISKEFFKHLKYYLNLSDGAAAKLLYAGQQAQLRTDGVHALNWRAFFFDG